MITFVADQCVFGKTVQLLRSEGHTVVTLKELEKQEATDDEVLGITQSLDAVLVTNDLDFSNILLYPPSSHAGIIVLRIDYRTMARVHQALRDLLQRFDRDALRGALVIVSSRGWRIRRTAVSE